MKLILFLVASCLALRNGTGAPTTASYKFVRCNPEGGQANCVTQQGPEMEWSPDLPTKLPASAAQYLEAEPEEEEEEETELSEDSPVYDLPEDGSGGFDGSADRDFVTAESETGSGESWTEKLDKGRDTRAMRRLFPSRSVGQAKAEELELREDHLLQL